MNTLVLMREAMIEELGLVFSSNIDNNNNNNK